MKRIVVGWTGASGAPYGIRTVECLLQAGCEVHLVWSDAACQVFKSEVGWDIGPGSAEVRERFAGCQNLVVYDNKSIEARIASGSARLSGMIIIPCSMSTVSALATGASNNLLRRTADVMLKERRPLIVVPRETPLSLIHLRNLTVLAEAGAVILPAMPAFYHHPHTIDDMVNFVVGRVLDVLGIENDLYKRYQGLE